MPGGFSGFPELKELLTFHDSAATVAPATSAKADSAFAGMVRFHYVRGTGLYAGPNEDGEWEQISAGGGGALDDLSDVTITAAAAGDYLRYDGAAWVDVAIAQLLTDIKTVDGAGSGLDADLLQGVTPSAFFLTLVDDAAAAAVMTTLGISANGQSLITAANYAAMKALLDLEIGVDVQAYDADLTTWAGLTPSANAQSLVTAANYAAMRALLDLEIGTDLQAWDADLDQIAALTRTRGDLIIGGAAAWTDLAIGASARILQSDGTDPSWVAVSGDITIAAGGATTIGADKVLTTMIADAQLKSLAALAYTGNAGKFIRVNAGETDFELAAVAGGSAHDLLDGSTHQDTLAGAVSRGSLIYGNATPLWAELVVGAANALLGTDGTDVAWFGCTAAGRAILDDASADAQRTTLGVGTGDSPMFTAVNLGHASDTTITRPSAGDISIEGNIVYRAGGTDVALADGGTGASLADPGGDRIMFWDDSAGAVTWLTAGTGLTITDTTMTASGSVVETPHSAVHLFAEATLTVSTAIVDSANLGNASDSDGNSTATTVTFNRPANSLCLVCIVNYVSGGTPNQPTFTQTGATWDVVDTQLFSGDNMRMTLFRSMSTSAVTGVAGSIACGGQNQTLIGWWGRSYTDVDLRGNADNGVSSLVQTIKNAVASATSLALNLAAMESDGSAAAAFYAASAPNNFTAGTGYTEAFESGTTPEFSYSADLATPATAAGPSFSATVDAAGFAVEIRRNPAWIAAGRFKHVAARHTGQTSIYPVINQARTSGGGAADYVVAHIYDETDDDEPGGQSPSTWARLSASVFTVPESCYDEGSATAISDLEDGDVYSVQLGALGDVNCGYKAWSANWY